MNPEAPRAEWYREHDLVAARAHPPQYAPFGHQSFALNHLVEWYNHPSSGPRGGVLVMPTGSGKTYTAVHFLCHHPLAESQPYKVLWLAHTHHLLEQAAATFSTFAGLIPAPRAQLNRVAAQ